MLTSSPDDYLTLNPPPPLSGVFQLGWGKIFTLGTKLDFDNVIYVFGKH